MTLPTHPYKGQTAEQKSEALTQLADRGQDILQALGAARLAHAGAQAALQAAEEQKAQLGYPASGTGKRFDVQLETWRNAVALVQQRKQAVAEAEKLVRKFDNERAAWARNVPLKQAELERTEAQERAAAEQAELEREHFADLYFAAMIQGGATRAEAEKALPQAWHKELARRAEAQLARDEQAMRANSRYTQF